MKDPRPKLARSRTCIGSPHQAAGQMVMLQGPGRMGRAGADRPLVGGGDPGRRSRPPKRDGGGAGSAPLSSRHYAGQRAGRGSRMAGAAGLTPAGGPAQPSGRMQSPPAFAKMAPSRRAAAARHGLPRRVQRRLRCGCGAIRLRRIAENIPPRVKVPVVGAVCAANVVLPSVLVR